MYCYLYFRYCSLHWSMLPVSRLCYSLLFLNSTVPVNILFFLIYLELSFTIQAWSSLLSLKFISWWNYLDSIRSGGHMFVWALLILNQIGTLGCVEPSTGQWCGECGRKVGQDSFIGVPTAMRRLWSQVLRYTVGHAKCFWIFTNCILSYFIRLYLSPVARLAVYTDSLVI